MLHKTSCNTCSLVSVKENRLDCFVIVQNNKQAWNCQTFPLLAYTKLHVHWVHWYDEWTWELIGGHSGTVVLGHCCTAGEKAVPNLAGTTMQRCYRHRARTCLGTFWQICLGMFYKTLRNSFNVSRTKLRLSLMVSSVTFLTTTRSFLMKQTHRDLPSRNAWINLYEP